MTITTVISLFIMGKYFHSSNLGLAVIFTLAWKRKRSIEWKTSFLLFLSTIGTFFLLNSDRWIGASTLTSNQFAIYSFFCILFLISQSVQAIISSSFFPILSRRMNSVGRDSSFRFMIITFFLTVVTGLVLSLPAYYVLSYIIVTFFPKYAVGITILPFILAVAIMRASDFWSSYLIVAKSEALILACHCGSALLGIVIWLAVLQPWNAAYVPNLQQVAGLAALLSVLSYLSRSGMCLWIWRRKAGAAAAAA